MARPAAKVTPVKLLLEHDKCVSGGIAWGPGTSSFEGMPSVRTAVVDGETVIVADTDALGQQVCARCVRSCDVASQMSCV
jgi:hypothetical protein